MHSYIDICAKSAHAVRTYFWLTSDYEVCNLDELLIQSACGIIVVCIGIFCAQHSWSHGWSHWLVFRRKDLCEAKHETQSVFRFSDVLFTLKSDIPPPPVRGIQWPRAVLHLVSLTFAVRHTQLRCVPPPSRGIQWPRAVLCQVSLTFAVRHTQLRCTPHRHISWPRPEMS